MRFFHTTLTENFISGVSTHPASLSLGLFRHFTTVAHERKSIKRLLGARSNGAHVQFYKIGACTTYFGASERRVSHVIHRKFTTNRSIVGVSTKKYRKFCVSLISVQLEQYCVEFGWFLMHYDTQKPRSARSNYRQFEWKTGYYWIQRTQK